MSRSPIEHTEFSPRLDGGIQHSLSSHTWDNMPRVAAPHRELPGSLDFSVHNIYPEAMQARSVPVSEVRHALEHAPSITFSSPAQDAKAHREPDYFLGADGKLRANPNAKPSKDGSINIEVQSKNKSETDAKKLADQLQKAAIKDLISYFRKNNPQGKIPEDWLAMLNREPDLPPPAEPIDNSPPPTAGPIPPEVQPPAGNPAPPVEAPQPQPSYDNPGYSGGGGGGGGYSGGGGGGYDGGYRPTDSTPRGDAPSFTPSQGDMNVEGPPTITPDKINEVLAQYHSPAQGLGQYIYDEGVKYGINPAVALAFFVQESSCGTAGVARETNSWGNIRGEGPAGSVNGFRAYHDYKEGVDDWYRLIHDKYLPPASEGGFGAHTLSQIISHYAPSSDNNNEVAYVHNVKGMVENWATA